MPQVRANLQNHFLQQAGWELCPFINLPVRGLPYPIDPSGLAQSSELLLNISWAPTMQGWGGSVENGAANTHVCMILHV